MNRKRILILVGVLLVLLLISVFLILYFSKEKKLTTPSQNTDTFPQTIPTPTQKPPPRLSLSSLANPTQLPTIPQQSAVYHIKTNYSDQEVESISKILGMTRQDNPPDSPVQTFYTLSEKEKKGFIVFDTRDGSFFFRSYGSYHPKNTTSGQLPNEIAYAFLQDIGIADETINCGISYQRKQLPSVTFVECHREWGKTGMPILNIIGLLNLPEAFPLTNLTLGMTYENDPEDTSIINTSTGQDGKQRPDDFNTATVAVGSNGNVVLATSNLKKIEAVQTITSNDFTPREKAWESFTQNKSTLSFVKPAGEGTVNRDLVFPNNQAIAQDAEVTDFMLAMLEGPSPQETLSPMYVIRGTATLTSGYRVVFVQAISAGEVEESFRGRTKTVAGVSDSRLVQQSAPADSLKLGTFGFQQGSGGNGEEECIPTSEQIYPQFFLQSYGNVGPYTIPPFPNEKRVGNYYFIPSETTLPDLKKVIEAFDAVQASMDIPGKNSSDDERKLNKLTNDWASFENCPMRLTGSSPTLFVYGDEGRIVRIQPDMRLTYADPPVSQENAWLTRIGSNTLTVNGTERNYIYYEFRPSDIPEGKTGWIVSRDTLADLAENVIAPALVLTLQERQRLVFELQHAASDVDSDHLLISPIDTQVIENTLPITTSPQMTFHRYIFTVSDATNYEKQNITSPLLRPVPRVTPFLLELGAIGKS